MVWSYKTKCEQHVFNTFTVNYIQKMSMIVNSNPTRKLIPAHLVTCTSFVWLYHLQCVRSCSREQNRVRDCCSHKHSDKHTWDLAQCSLSLVPFAAAWARVRGDITCLAQGHLEHGLSWCLIFLFPYLDFFFPFFFFTQLISLIRPYHPKVTEWKRSAPISYYCNDSDEIAISLSMAAHRLGFSDSRGWTLGTCVSAQTAEPAE